MNTRQARKARAKAVEAIYAQRRPQWGHLEQLTFLLALSFGATIYNAAEVWNRVRAEPMVPNLEEFAYLVAVTHRTLLDEQAG